MDFKSHSKRFAFEVAGREGGVERRRGKQGKLRGAPGAECAAGRAAGGSEQLRHLCLCFSWDALAQEWDFSLCFTWHCAKQKQSVCSECCHIKRRNSEKAFPFGNLSRGRFFYMDLGSFSFFF